MKKVTMYSGDPCPFCGAAKALLKTKNVEIENISKILLEKNDFIFHAGTKKNNSKIISNGGRVLNFVVLSPKFQITCRCRLCLSDPMECRQVCL